MTSQINPNNIDGNYPVAGQPNNTQGMRDNFTNTKTNFQYAEDEINDLQSKAILKSALTGGVVDNNMNDTLLYAVQLSDVSYKEIQLTATSGTVTLDYEAAMYQAMPSVSGNVSLAFTNWPTSGQVGAMRFAIVVSNTAYTLTLPASVSVGLTTIDGISPGTPGVTNTITFAAVGVYIFEFLTSNAGAAISIQAMIRPSTTYSNVIDITNTTPSTSTTTGALIVAGGVGIGANLNVGGDFTTYNTSNATVFSVSSTTGYVHINTGNIPANTEGALNIVGTTDGSYQPVVQAGGMLHITGNDGVSARFTHDSFGTGANPTITGRRARGTAASPTVPQNNDVLLRFTATGWNGSGYGPTSTASPLPTGIDFVAKETFSGTALGSEIQFYNAPIGSNVRTLSATVSANATSLPAALSVTGNVTAGNVTTTGLMSSTGNAIHGNISTAGLITATGNIISTGNILAADGGAVGYTNGAGGTVSQTGNKSGGVTLNKITGEITMQNTALAGNNSVSFTLTNNTIGARDLLLINLVGGGTAGAYYFGANCTTGSAIITVANRTGGSLSEALVLRYAVIRGSIA